MILERFGDYVFPVYEVTDTLSAEARADIYSTPVGGFDPNGSERAVDRPGRIVKVAEICEDSHTAFRAHLDAARALRGKRARLWARTAADTDGATEVRWIWGRCQSIGVQRGMRNHRYQSIVYTFAVANQYWNGVGHADWELDDGTFLDTGYYLDTGNFEGVLNSITTEFVVTNGGNRAVTNVILAIQPTVGENIEDITIRIGDAELVWTGIISEDTQLLIDTGSYRVTNDGDDAYAGLSFGPNHTIDDWLRIEPGDNDIVFEWGGTGGPHVWSMNFWDGWY